ncbi:PEP-CTERM sorting domain-containing protein [Verrucomicrobiota bacterium sgz303538]
MKYLLTLTAAVAVAHTSTAAYFADQVLSYTPGSGVTSLNQAQAALGAPSPIVGAGSGFDSVYSPFNPHYEASDIVAIGAGGQLTLQLSHFVTIDRTPGVFEIGVWENVFFSGLDWPSGGGKTGNPVNVTGADSAVVEVSQDGVNWYSLNGGAPILFTLPGNYYTNAGPFDSAAPASPQLADFGKPFTGSLSDFDNKSYSEILTVLNGSAGGTWLNLDSAPLQQVGFVRFSGVAAGQNLEVDAVAINTSLAGSAVPEPSAGVLAMMGIGMIGALRRKRA